MLPPHLPLSVTLAYSLSALVLRWEMGAVECTGLLARLCGSHPPGYSRAAGWFNLQKTEQADCMLMLCQGTWGSTLQALSSH